MEHSLTEKRTLVIGGANIDICGQSAGTLVLNESNPGTVTLRPGGVGRNIAHDLRLFGVPVSLMAAVGDDMNGAALLADCKRLGMDVSLCRTVRGARSSTYLYISDSGGDLLAAVNDMDITEELSPAFLASVLAEINGFDAVVLDANLPEKSIVFLAENCTASMSADAVSAAKARRLLPILGKLRALKCNLAEAEALTGEQDAARAAEKLLAAGVKQVYISLGAAGLYAAERGRAMLLPAIKAEVVNTNGAGDAAAAAVVCAGLLGLGLPEAAAAAIKAGAAAVSAVETNPETLQGCFQQEERI